jgi:hypothetical protein
MMRREVMQALERLAKSTQAYIVMYIVHVDGVVCRQYIIVAADGAPCSLCCKL